MLYYNRDPKRNHNFDNHPFIQGALSPEPGPGTRNYQPCTLRSRRHPDIDLLIRAEFQFGSRGCHRMCITMSTQTLKLDLTGHHQLEKEGGRLRFRPKAHRFQASFLALWLRKACPMCCCCIWLWKEEGHAASLELRTQSLGTLSTAACIHCIVVMKICNMV